MTGETPWQAYFWPNTQVLRNKLNEHDPVRLQQAEYEISEIRQGQLERGEVVIPRTYDTAHLQAIHGHLFQDVYDWAGQYRAVNMGKGGQTFADTRWIEPYLAATHDMIKETKWNGLDRDQFAQATARVFAYVNYTHPSGRATGAPRRSSWHTSPSSHGSASTSAGLPIRNGGTSGTGRRGNHIPAIPASRLTRLR